MDFFFFLISKKGIYSKATLRIKRTKQSKNYKEEQKNKEKN